MPGMWLGRCRVPGSHSVTDDRAFSERFELDLPHSGLMTQTTVLLPELLEVSAKRLGERTALTYGAASCGYRTLAERVAAFRNCVLALGLGRAERVAVFLEKRFETVIACFGAAAAGGAFVPVNPLLKPDQVTYILRDCNVRVIVTSSERLALLRETLRSEEHTSE